MDKTSTQEFQQRLGLNGLVSALLAACNDCQIMPTAADWAISVTASSRRPESDRAGRGQSDPDQRRSQRGVRNSRLDPCDVANEGKLIAIVAPEAGSRARGDANHPLGKELR